MPVYRVKLADKHHIIVANLASQAIRHVTRKLVTCEAITAEELAGEIEAGRTIEKADLQAADPVVPAMIDPPYKHKIACGADGTIPIGGLTCKCTQLPIEVRNDPA